MDSNAVRKTWPAASRTQLLRELARAAEAAKTSLRSPSVMPPQIPNT